MWKLALLAAATAVAVALGVQDDAALCLDAFFLFLAAMAHMLERMRTAGGLRCVPVLLLLPFLFLIFGTAGLPFSSPADRFPFDDLLLFIVLSLVALQVTGDAHADRARRLFEQLHFLTAAVYFTSCDPVEGKTADARLLSFDVLVLFLAGMAVIFARMAAAAPDRSRALVTLIPFLLIRFVAAGAFSIRSLIYRFKVDALTASAVLLFRTALLAGCTEGGEPPALHRERAAHHDRFTAETFSAFAMLSVVFLSVDDGTADASIYLDTFVLFLAGMALLFVRIWAADAPADRAPRTRDIALQVVPFLLFAKLCITAVFIPASDVTGGIKPHPSIYLDASLLLFVGFILLCIRVWATNAPAEIAHRAHAATLLAFLFAKLAATILLCFFSLNPFEGINANACSSWDFTVLLVIASGVLVFAHI